MFNKLFGLLYNKIFVNIVVKHTSTQVYIEVFSKSKVLEHTQKEFKTTTLNEVMINFIQHYTKESPFYYISILNISNEQGVLSSCKKGELSNSIDLNTIEYKCYQKIWAHYSSRLDIQDIQKQYKEIGVDYIFSPFSILANFFKEKIVSQVAMFILIQDSSLSLAIYEKSKLLFGKHLDMQKDEEGDDELLSDDIDEFGDDEEGIDLEDVELLEDIESLDDIDEFGDIEDLDSLDSLEEIDDFSDDEDLEEELSNAQEESVTEMGHSDTDFNEEYQRFSLIQTTLGYFYNDTKYDSKFVETIYIADDIGVSGDLKRYLEEEMFLNVYIRKIDISMELAELTKMELML